MEYAGRKQIEEVYQNIRLDEGISVLYRFLEYAYLHPGSSVKQLANHLFLPVPVVSAMKNELKRHAFVQVKNGIHLSDTGKEFVELQLGYAGINTELLNQFLEQEESVLAPFAEEIAALREIYEHRPEVDVTIDQSKCTAETGIRRALLMLKNGTLIGKRIACIGDDDLNSIAMVLVLSHFAQEGADLSAMTSVTVYDIDQRILAYIAQLAEQYGASITCISHDFRQPIPQEQQKMFDFALTDPPYTMEGLSLFLSRGLSLLKAESNLCFFVAFAHKNPQTQLTMQELFVRSGLIIRERLLSFNQYDGAQILGGVSDLYLLTTTPQTKEVLTEAYQGLFYTNETNRTVRTYRCKQCGERYQIGFQQQLRTIEQLKQTGCSVCRSNTFVLEKKEKEREQHGTSN